ncbi:unnamed protein product, partial [Cylicostephanus goldi]
CLSSKNSFKFWNVKIQRFSYFSAKNFLSILYLDWTKYHKSTRLSSKLTSSTHPQKWKYAWDSEMILSTEITRMHEWRSSVRS